MLRNTTINNTTINGASVHASRRVAMAVIMLILSAATCFAQTDNSVKGERINIRDGNKAYNAGNYQKALDFYTEALDINPLSEVAQFNSAVALTRLAAGQDSTLMSQAQKIYQALGTSATDASIKERANYNLGNLAFNAQNYPLSIEYYKKVLRSNPSNQKARENLRVAQLKLPPEDQQDQDQQQQDQQQQEQPQQQDQQQQQQQQPQQQQQNGNADQILQSMQNRENQTRRDAEKREVPVGVPVTDKPW